MAKYNRNHDEMPILRKGVNYLGGQKMFDTHPHMHPHMHPECKEYSRTNIFKEPSDFKEWIYLIEIRS